MSFFSGSGCSAKHLEQQISVVMFGFRPSLLNTASLVWGICCRILSGLMWTPCIELQIWASNTVWSLASSRSSDAPNLLTLFLRRDRATLIITCQQKSSSRNRGFTEDANEPLATGLMGGGKFCHGGKYEFVSSFYAMPIEIETSPPYLFCIAPVSILCSLWRPPRLELPVFELVIRPGCPSYCSSGDHSNSILFVLCCVALIQYTMTDIQIFGFLHCHDGRLECKGAWMGRGQ